MIDLAIVAGRVRDEWRRRFAEWEDEPFAAVAAGPGAALATALAAEPGGDKVVDGYLRLVAEALRLRYLDRATCVGQARPTDLLGRCLVDVLPRRLPAYPADRRLPLLARVWNLGEGLLRQAPWMARLAAALIPDADDLERLDEALARALAPLTEAPAPSSFAGPFEVAVLDLSALDADFLPGEMHAAAPAVLCVHDRLRGGIHAAVVVGRTGASRTLGASPCLASAGGDGPPGGAAVDVRFAPNSVRIAGQAVVLPSVRRAHAHVVLPAGFLAISAVDSQRLWIVESAA